MSRSIYKLLSIPAALVFSQGLWAQSYGIIHTFAGNGNSGFRGDGGPATEAQLDDPAEVAIHPNGDIYIADQGNNRIRKIDSNGTITTIAGNGLPLGFIDNIPAIVAGLKNPSGIAFDTAGNLYIAETGNNRIRRVDSGTGIITTVAGTGQNGYNGDNQPATNAQLNSPYRIAFDSAGNLFIADTDNHRIRRVDARTHFITTVAGIGNSGDTGDEEDATHAKLRSPQGVLVDAAGNLYIADTGNHRVRVVDPSGVIHAFAGTGTSGDDGDQGNAKLARLRLPIGLGTDATRSNIYIADFGANRIRQVNIGLNRINTVAGNGRNGYSGDGGPSAAAEISEPQSATLDVHGRIYIAQYGSHVIRAVDPYVTAATVEVFSGSPQSTAVSSAFSLPLIAIVKDTAGLPLPGIRVTFSAPTSGASAALVPATAVTTDANGRARVNATANTSVGAYVVTAAATGVTVPAVFNLTNTAGAAATIQFVQQPKDASAGAVIKPPVTVSLKDANNNPIVGAPITLTVLSGAATLEGGGPANTNSSGVATFGSLKITQAGTYRLQASGASLTATSSSFAITAGSQISFAPLSGGGQSASAGAPYAAPLKATVQDTFGNPIAGVAVTFTAPATGPSVTFSGSSTVTTDSLGVATSPVITANGQTGVLQVTATASGAPRRSHSSWPMSLRRQASWLLCSSQQTRLPERRSLPP